MAKLKPAYMTCSFGYTIDLYCRNEDCSVYRSMENAQAVASCDGPKCYYEARKQAKNMGWKLHKDGSATCPTCIKKSKTLHHPLPQGKAE